MPLFHFLLLSFNAAHPASNQRCACFNLLESNLPPRLLAMYSMHHCTTAPPVTDADPDAARGQPARIERCCEPASLCPTLPSPVRQHLSLSRGQEHPLASREAARPRSAASHEAYVRLINLHTQPIKPRQTLYQVLRHMYSRVKNNGRVMKPILSLHVPMLVFPAPGFSHQQQPGIAEE
jgi:hypothetical protein